MPKRKKVTVRGEQVSFPRVCSKCLSKEDLKSFTTEWSGSILVSYQWPEKRYAVKKAKIDVPICNSCKEKMKHQTRKKYAIAFAILAALIMGAFVYMKIQGAATGDWGGILAGGFLCSLIPGAFPLYVLAKPEVFLKWPVNLEEQRNWGTKIGEVCVGNPFAVQSIFSFENEDYYNLFVAANKWNIVA